MNTNSQNTPEPEEKDEKKLNQKVDFEKLNTPDIEKLPTLEEIRKGTR
jgi:hypothetical protein